MSDVFKRSLERQIERETGEKFILIPKSIAEELKDMDLTQYKVYDNSYDRYECFFCLAEEGWDFLTRKIVPLKHDSDCLGVKLQSCLDFSE